MSSEPNPVRGNWYGYTEEPLPGSPCHGCRRGLRRGHFVDDDCEILQHHLVREGVTIDCTGLNYRIDLLLAKWVTEDAARDEGVQGSCGAALECGSTCILPAQHDGEHVCAGDEDGRPGTCPA